MKSPFRVLKQEFVSIALILISFFPILFIGSILDILLTHFYAHGENGKRVLPAISQWIHDWIAGHRFLPQEIMLCFWILMVLCFILNAFIAGDQHKFRIRFIYSFLLIWILVIATATFIVLACVAPFDILLARINENGLFGNIIHIILVFELILIIIMPVGLFIWRRVKISGQGRLNEDSDRHTLDN